MPHARYLYFLLSVLLVLLLAGCEGSEAVCPPDEGTPRARLRLEELIALPPPGPGEPVEVFLRGKSMKVDKLVEYPLCNDNWSGTVYVSCKAQVAEAELDADSNPLFLKGCDLNIAPNTVVYVAAHNDAPFYKGCSCHTGSAPSP